MDDLTKYLQQQVADGEKQFVRDVANGKTSKEPNRAALKKAIVDLQADLAATQAIIVDAGQHVADLKAENAQLRKDIESLRKIVKAATEYANAHFYAEPQWKLNRLFEDMCSAMDTPQPKEDKQS